MNLLLHLRPSDYDRWRSGFDADYEERMHAGLTLLQLWRAVDGDGVTALFDCNDQGRAEAWLERQRATGATMESRFLVTA